jgi:hypothetical protein
MSEKSHVTIKRDETIAIPSSEQEKRYGIRYHDWERCKRKLEKINHQVPRFHLIYSFFFGVSATAVSSLVTSWAQGGSYPSWLIPWYIGMAAIGLIIGILFVYVDRTFRGEQKTDISELMEDMDAIEKTFSP